MGKWEAMKLTKNKTKLKHKPTDHSDPFIPFCTAFYIKLRFKLVMFDNEKPTLFGRCYVPFEGSQGKK